MSCLRGLGCMFLALSLALGLLGCGRGAEEEAAEQAAERAIEAQMEQEGGGDVEVDLAEERLEIKTEESQMTIDADGGVKMPDDFPKDVFTLEGAKVVASMKQGRNFTLSMTSQKPVAEVAEVYQEKMKSQGWEEEFSANISGNMMLHYKKGDRTCAVQIADNEDTTQIMLTVGQE